MKVKLLSLYILTNVIDPYTAVESAHTIAIMPSEVSRELSCTFISFIFIN